MCLLFQLIVKTDSEKSGQESRAVTAFDAEPSQLPHSQKIRGDGMRPVF